MPSSTPRIAASTVFGLALSTPACGGVSAPGEACRVFFADQDGDGWGGDEVTMCGPQSQPGLVGRGGDCDDGNADIHRGATEVCDGADQDCDGVPDDGLDFYDWYQDADGDGFGADFGIAMSACSQPEGRVQSNDDCDDASATIHPGASETFCDGIDSDCDGSGLHESAVVDGVAFATIQEAVDRAPSGGTVEICPGTWSESVEIQAEAVLSLRGLHDAEEVVLEGQSAGPLLTVGEGASVEVTDLTFTNTAVATDDGGAIQSSASELLLHGCRFAGNIARRGGAIAAKVPLSGDEGLLIAEDCTFTDNDGVFEGGAVVVLAREGDVGFSVALNSCVFLDNRSGAGGGALSYLISDGARGIGGLKLEAIATTFQGNDAVGNGGALSLVGGDSTIRQDLVIEGCEFDGNCSHGEGGAVFRQIGFFSSISVSGTTFTSNSSDLGGGAFGTYGVDYAAVAITNSTFTGNRTQGSGAAILIASGASSLDIIETDFIGNLAQEEGGALALTFNVMVVNIEKSLFDRNTATESGAILIDNDVVAEISGTVFTGNSATAGGAGAIGVTDRARSSILALQESILEANTAQAFAGGLCIQDLTDLTVDQVDWGSDATENTPADLCVGATCWVALATGESFSCPGDGTCSW